MTSAIIPLTSFVDFISVFGVTDIIIWSLYFCLCVCLLGFFPKKAKEIGKLAFAVAAAVVLFNWIRCFVVVVVCEGNIAPALLWRGAAYTGIVFGVGLAVYIVSLVVRIFQKK